MIAPIRATKMSGAGNDFVVLRFQEAAKLGDGLLPWIRRVCRRGLSIGADGVLILDPSSEGRVRVTFHNPDGSMAFCGNGSRCAARYAFLAGWTPARSTLLTSAGEVSAEVRGDEVRLLLKAPAVGERVTFDGGLSGTKVDAGCPHVVVWIPDVDHASIAELGPPIRHDPRFAPAGTNVDLVTWCPDGSLAVRTWERGVEGETLSCGTGALAAAAVARALDGRAVVRVVPRSGVPLEVRFDGPDGPSRVILAGDARVVFEGEIGTEATSGFAE